MPRAPGAAQPGLGLWRRAKLDLQADVERPNRMGQRTDRDEIDARWRNARHRLQRDIARGFQRHPSGGWQARPGRMSSRLMLSSMIRSTRRLDANAWCSSCQAAHLDLDRQVG